MLEQAPIFMIAAIVIPVIAGALCFLCHEKWISLWSNIAAPLTLICVGVTWFAFDAGHAVEMTLFPILAGQGGGEALGFTFRVDALGMTFALLASGLWVLASWYTIGYADADHMKHRNRFFACFAIAIGAAIGIAFSSNLLVFLICYEMLTLSTYPLVAHKEHDEAIGAGRRYLLLSLAGGLLITAGSAWTWVATGTLDFAAGGFVGQAFTGGALTVLFAMMLTGTCVKAAVMPLHSWLPAAMVAPTPVSALLHAVAVVKAGVFACMRMLGYVFGPEVLSGTLMVYVLLFMTLLTITVGSMIALRHTNLKRRLAFSTVVHLSYIVAGAALMTELGFTGSVLHMVNHGLCKITLFFVAGAIYATHHLEDIHDMKGIARKMPWTCGAFAVATLGLMGVPGLAGFVSKFFLVRGAVEGGDWLALGVMLIGSVFTAVYLLPVVKIMIFDKPAPAPGNGHAHGHDDHGDGHDHHEAGEANRPMRYALLGTAALVVIFGIVPYVMNLQYDLAARVASTVFAGGTP